MRTRTLMTQRHIDQWRIQVFCVTFLLLLLSCQSHGLPTRTPSVDTTAPNRNAEQPGKNGLQLFVPLRTIKNSSCKLYPVKKSLPQKVKDILKDNIKLIEYHVSIANYTINPLKDNMTWAYKADTWSRTASRHGKTLVSLAFNYGVLSLTTLSFGVKSLNVELYDKPYGCMGRSSEQDKIDAMLYLLLRDFRADGQVTLRLDQEDVCHQVINRIGSSAQFTDRCCHMPQGSTQVHCTSDTKNAWLKIMDILLACVKICALLFGPLMIPDWLYNPVLDNVPYKVKLKEPLVKKIYITANKHDRKMPRAKHVINLCHKSTRSLFQGFKRIVTNMPLGEILRVKVSEFDISVSYKRLLVENSVPVGVMRSIMRTIFFCKIKQIGPFKDCCEANALWKFRSYAPIKWIDLGKVISKCLIVLFIPLPFYIRILLFYFWENPELQQRQNALRRVGASQEYEHKIMQYLTPTHPIFIMVYIIYFFTCAALAILHSRNMVEEYQQLIVSSFRDLQKISWVKAIATIVSSFLWPFKKFGLLGFIVGILYWPIAMPLSLVLCACYYLPLLYLTFRMFIRSRKDLLAVKSVVKQESLQQKLQVGLTALERRVILRDFNSEHQTSTEETVEPPTCKQTCWRFFRGALVIISIYALMLMLAECVGFITEVFVFTFMGIIVNAGRTVKYVSMIILVTFYSYDCYNNVYKKYLKLNKAIFNEVKGRIKDVEEVTSLPSYLQENQGFKSQENSEQAAYEQPDGLRQDKPYHWELNDLVLFIDKEDMPRIPKRLFHDICQIEVAGSPGPVFQSMVEATKKFLTIVIFLFFVFIVVMSFGNVYHVSSTNQTLATLAGGFMPFLLRYVLHPTTPDIELGTVSFKSKMDEIIKNFKQTWPMHDFTFEKYVEESLEGETDKVDEDHCKHKDNDSDKDDKPKVFEDSPCPYDVHILIQLPADFQRVAEEWATLDDENHTTYNEQKL